MGINVIVAKKNNGILSTTAPVTLKNAPTLAAATRLDKLSDVDPTGEANGATLVYNQTNDKYIVKNIDFTDIAGNLDGGTF